MSDLEKEYLKKFEELVKAAKKLSDEKKAGGGYRPKSNVVRDGVNTGLDDEAFVSEEELAEVVDKLEEVKKKGEVSEKLLAVGKVLVRLALPVL